MKRFLLLFAAMLACVSPVAAQNFTSVTASNVQNASGTKLAAGQICFLGTDATDTPISFQAGGGGMVITGSVCASITNGAIVGGFQVANPANTNPAGVLYRITLKNSNSGGSTVYTGVSFSGGSFNFDSYAPVGAAVLPPTGGSVNGPLSVNGNASVTGALSAGSATFNGPVVANVGGTIGLDCAGDSRMAGSTLIAGQDLCALIAAQPRFAGAAYVHNGAVGGATCSSMTSVYAANVQPYKPAGAVTKVYLFILDGINEFLTGGQLAPQVQSCMSSYLAQAVFDGFTPVLLTSYYSSSLTDAQEAERQKYNNWLRSQPYLTIDIDRQFPSSPDNPYYGIGSSSVPVTAYTVQPGVAILSSTGGSGYSGSVTCTVSGGTFTTPATCSGFVNTSNQIVPFMTNPGVYSSTSGVTITVSATGGSGATVTPWGTQVATFTAANTYSMNTATATNQAVYLSGFATSTWLNGLTSTATPNGLSLVFANSTSFGLVVSHATTGTVTESGLAQLVSTDPTHLGPAGVLLEAKAVNNLFGVGGATTYSSSLDRSYEAPLGGIKRISGILNIGNFSINTSAINGDVQTARTATTGVLFCGNDGGYCVFRDTPTDVQVGKSGWSATMTTLNATNINPVSVLQVSTLFTTPAIRTNSASNKDLGGELSLSAATTASYTFAVSYAIHPECMVLPQFDPGSGVRYWVTYTGSTSFTVTFSTAVTGSVSYHCIARN